jgi:ribonucleoside-diphosphate reductase beta chain
MKVAPFRVFDGEKNNVATKVFGGSASGIRDWDNIKYPIMLTYQQHLFNEYWTPEEVKLGKDIEQYKSVLTEKERYVYNILTGMLNQLDSHAQDFNFYLISICTDPSVRSVLELIMSFEGMHNRSYQYLTASMLNFNEKKETFESIKKMPVLTKKNEVVLDKIQAFADKVFEYYTLKKDIDRDFLQVLFEALLAYQVLEGIYFSAGFVYFHSLAKDQKMIGSNNMINLIKADETQHSSIFGTLVRILMDENPDLNTEENLNYAIEYIRQCVELEKEWGRFIFKDIETLNINEYCNYVEYLANNLCRNAGFDEPYPDNKELKSKWILTYGSKKRDKTRTDQIVTRTDFLQGNAINYEHESGEGFDL